MSSSHPLCNLRVSRQEADTKLAERIDTGEALLSSAEQLREEVFSGVGYERVPDIKHTERHDSLWSEYSRWNDFNKALLNRLFDSQEIAVEYSTPKEPKPTYGVLLAEIEEFENVLKDDLQELRSIKERLPLFEEVLPRALIQTAKSNAMNRKNFLTELKRRNVYKVAVAYAVVAWLLMQIASQIFPFFEIPNWAVRLVVLLLIIGFPIALIIAWAFEVTPEGIKRTEAADAAGQRSRGGAWIYIILIGAAVSVGLFFVGRYTAGRATPQQGEATAAIPQKSIAVLPLLNESGDPKDEYFSDGLSEELIAALAQISGLKVIGRSSSFRFKDRKEEPKTIGEKLGVTTLLEGTVRKQGDRVRIVAELVNVADGIELWTRTFDRELKDIFAVQQEIAAAVAASLKITLLGSEKGPTANSPTKSTEAHNAYLLGHYYFQRRNLDDYRRAVAHFDEAIRLDPDYALPYAERSEAWIFIGDLTGQGKTMWPKARSDAEKAVAIAPTLAEAHAALGYVRYFTEWKFIEGLSELKRAKELSPVNPTANDLLARVIVYLGRLDEAERQARHAVELDPLSFPPQHNLARVLCFEGKLDEADAVARKSVELQPTAAASHRWQVLVAVQRGDGETALREAQLEPDEGYRRFELALAQYVRGDRPAADAALADLIATGRGQLDYQIAEVYALRGETDKAFEWLQISYDSHDTGTLAILVDPLLRDLRNDPRYKSLVARMAFPAAL